MENSVDYKLGKISADIESIKKDRLEDVKIRDENHRMIDEISKVVSKFLQRFDDATLRWDSWKDGQTLYMHKTTEDITSLKDTVDSHKTHFHERLLPLEEEFKKKSDDKKDTNTRVKDAIFSSIRYIIGVILLSIFINSRIIWNTIMAIANKL